jgi:hypothetical protein
VQSVKVHLRVFWTIPAGIGVAGGLLGCARPAGPEARLEPGIRSSRVGPALTRSLEIVREELAVGQGTIALGEHFDAALRDQHRVLELGGKRAVGSHRGPVVV